MKSRLDLRRILVAVLAGVLIGGGLMAVTPAGAEVAQSAATNWKKIWKKKLQPLADKRYYTKKQSDATFARKTDLGNYYTKAESDTKYQPKGNYALSGSSYTKAESDAKYAPAQPLYRGTFQILGNVPAAGHAGSASISWGATFPAALTPHYIKVGEAVPAGCSGSSTAPNASPGNFCVFESLQSNAGANRSVCRGAAPATCGTTDPWGAGIYTYAAAAGVFYVYGTWAARPGGPVVNPSLTSPTPDRAAGGSSGADPTGGGR
jgi:hypothetical protein